MTPVDLDLARRILRACPLDAEASVDAQAGRFGVPWRRYSAVIEGLIDEGLVEIDLTAAAYVLTPLGVEVAA